MNTRNSCYTYFSIVGDFDPDLVSKLLNLQPDRTEKIGDVGRIGRKCCCASWEFGRCSEYDVDVSVQMRKTISPLLSKVDILNWLREENDVRFYLEVVPKIYAGNINPALGPDLDIIDFCHATRTEIDIDMYVYNSEEE